MKTGNRSDRLDRPVRPVLYRTSSILEFLPSLTLAQLQLGVVPLNMISNIFLVPAHTETAQPSRSKWKHKVITREISSEANHKDTQGGEVVVGLHLYH